MYIYIHIPFCSSICSYCDFAKVFYNKTLVTAYLNSLEKEIDKRYNNNLVKTIYIGGGTPTCLDYEELKRLLNITNKFKTTNNLEFTIESNVEIDENKIKLLKEYNVNRISIGVQSFNDKILKTLNRTHKKNDVIKTIKLLKENNFKNINIDLIYGVEENIEIIKEDLKTFLKLDIPHISYYSLIIEDNTLLKINKFKQISEEIDYAMYKYIEETLEDNNYIHYEISNYCKEGMMSIHNKNYWLNGNYLGFGLGAVSYIDNKRISNTKNINKYIENNNINEELYENLNTRMQTDIMLGLRLIEGINIKNFKNKYNKDIYEVIDINNYLNNGIIEITNGYLKINKKYIYLSNEILVNILK